MDGLGGIIELLDDGLSMGVTKMREELNLGRARLKELILGELDLEGTWLKELKELEQFDLGDLDLGEFGLEELSLKELGLEELDLTEARPRIVDIHGNFEYQIPTYYFPPKEGLFTPLVSQMRKGGTINTYEEARKQRLEENKKRFEDLGISRISKNLTEITSSAKKSGHHVHKPKPKKSNGEVEPRQSSRVRNPVPSYREDVSIHLPALRKRSISSTRGSYTARPLDEIKEATEEERLYALEAAEALQINLNSSYPSFIKSMLWSHVYRGFWLGLPSKFCEEHFPKTVCDMILEDENGSEYKAVYIGNKSGLSGGWRAFALDHKLDDGDALVFELIEPSRFKIYIVRAYPNLVEEKGNDILVGEGNMHATKVRKAKCNLESESKTKKPKRAASCDTNESESSQEHIDKKVKPQDLKGKVQLKTEKPVVSLVLSKKTKVKGY
ncbi:putative B3 domain-containing protein [Vigna angularis]|uniref:Putative B3 domain-containing protein n=1 Tax=Phaseolus angularis TaxID=3914 RepID=A0A8T0K301_PHAAN|nr:putative B3 domain-containing protein [Vigna angularis]